MLLKAEKQAIMKEYAIHEGDTGSPEVQIAVLTEQINRLTEHFKEHRHQRERSDRVGRDRQHLCHRRDG